MLYKNIKMEPRGEEDPKFNMKNKTDRKLFWTLFGVTMVVLALLVGIIFIYYKFFYVPIE